MYPFSYMDIGNSTMFSDDIEKLCRPFIFWFGVPSAQQTKLYLIRISDSIPGNGRVYGVAKIIVDEGCLLACALVGSLEYVSLNRVMFGSRY